MEATTLIDARSMFNIGMGSRQERANQVLAIRDALETFVTAAIDLTDALAFDFDAEDNGDDEPTGDENDAAWIEWHTRRLRKTAQLIVEPFSDNEAEGTEDDFITHYGNYGPGCAIGDPDVEHCGREPDDEGSAFQRAIFVMQCCAREARGSE